MKFFCFLLVASTTLAVNNEAQSRDLRKPQDASDLILANETLVSISSGGSLNTSDKRGGGGHGNSDGDDGSSGSSGNSEGDGGSSGSSSSGSSSAGRSGNGSSGVMETVPFLTLASTTFLATTILALPDTSTLLLLLIASSWVVGASPSPDSLSAGDLRGVGASTRETRVTASKEVSDERRSSSNIQYLNPTNISDEKGTHTSRPLSSDALGAMDSFPFSTLMSTTFLATALLALPNINPVYLTTTIFVWFASASPSSGNLSADESFPELAHKANSSNQSIGIFNDGSVPGCHSTFSCGHSSSMSPNIERLSVVLTVGLAILVIAFQQNHGLGLHIASICFSSATLALTAPTIASNKGVDAVPEPPTISSPVLIQTQFVQSAVVPRDDIYTHPNSAFLSTFDTSSSADSVTFGDHKHPRTSFSYRVRYYTVATAASVLSLMDEVFS